MDEQEEVQQKNMISNLPLLFASGYPTSLEKITEPQLENFIPFMVQCSLGHINLQGKLDCSEPEWWPEDISFTIPFSKPKKFTGNWMEKMKEIVLICYQFHKSVFLLRFCNDLASYEHACLRFINNYNSTTSLFDRRCNKLLVTFRNENMSYDQPQRSRKCLLQQKSKNEQPAQEMQQMMVEPAPFDIYLCDNCDAELYSKDAILEHEKTCHIDDDDVILCDSPEPHEDNEHGETQNCCENNELRRGFLLNFNLQHREDAEKLKNAEINKANAPASNATEESGATKVSKNKRAPRRNRQVHSLTRSPIIPLSSPAGQILQRINKTILTPEYLDERFDRMERFCHAPILLSTLSKPKYFEKKSSTTNPHCTFKRPQEYSAHMFVFPRRQFSQRRRTENFLFLNSPLIRRCRPISVRLKKITDQDMKSRQTSSTNAKLNIRLTRDTTQSSSWKISSPTTEIIVDTINLCSSDDDDNNGETPQSATLPVLPSADTSLSTRAVASSETAQIEKVNTPRTRLKRSSNPAAQSDVSLIPIKKALNNCTIKYDKGKRSPSLNKVVATPLPNDISTTSAKNSNSHYEGNILVSPSTGVTIEGGGMMALPKPLRPSVFIFSNYTSNPLAAVVAAANEPGTNADNSNSNSNSNFINHNQENQIQSSMNSSYSNKRISNPTTLSVAEWFPEASNSQSGNSSSNSQGHSIERTRSLVRSFGSPNRVVSIDLTS